VTDWDHDDREHPGAGQTNRSKAIIAIVLTVAMLGSIVLCCMLAGSIGELQWLPLPPP
jgi:hypothetical protein